jgi:hypothetical protein
VYAVDGSNVFLNFVTKCIEGLVQTNQKALFYSNLFIQMYNSKSVCQSTIPFKNFKGSNILRKVVTIWLQISKYFPNVLKEGIFKSLISIS